VVLTTALVARVDSREVSVGSCRLPCVCWWRRTRLEGCPGCGLTRSTLLFLQMRPGDSLETHPAGWILALCVLIYPLYSFVCIFSKTASSHSDLLLGGRRWRWLCLSAVLVLSLLHFFCKAPWYRFFH
jgi:hypothetical protein